MLRFAVILLVSCGSSKPTTGDDSWKQQLLPDAAIDATDAGSVGEPVGDGERVRPRTEPAGAGPAQKVRCLRLVGCGCDYGCSMGFWEAGADWKVNFRDAGTIAQIAPQCVGKTCVDVFVRDVCQKSCTPAPSLAKCQIIPDNVWRCEPE